MIFNFSEKDRKFSLFLRDNPGEMKITFSSQ